MRKRFSGILTVLMLAVLTFPALAFAGTHGSKTPPPPPQDKVQAVAPMSTRYLSAWGCSIDQRSSNSVLLSGYSESYMPVSKIWVTLYLQRWDGSQWVTISGGYNATAYNTVSVTGKHNLTVTPGYYYRTMARHQCYNNGSYDPASPAVSTSGYIYVY